MHKSFGEYLTAKALLEAFLRWSSQIDDGDSEFNESDFLSRWVRIACNSRVTFEIFQFMRDEARLYVKRSGGVEVARQRVDVLVRLLDDVHKYGIAVQGTARTSKDVNSMYVLTEGSLFALLNSFARAAFPSYLFGGGELGWRSGPIKLQMFENDSRAVTHFFVRQLNERPLFVAKQPASFYLSHISLQRASLLPYFHRDADFEGCDLSHCVFYFGSFNANLSYANLYNSDMSSTSFHVCDFTSSNLNEADASDTNFANCTFDDAELYRVRVDESNLLIQNLTDEQKDQILLYEVEDESDANI